MLILYLLLLIFSFRSSLSSQFYDTTSCSLPTPSPGSRYACNSPLSSSCNTFIVYRARRGLNNASSISKVFDADLHQVLQVNNLADSSELLEDNREILLPIKCSCSSGFFRSELIYTVPYVMTYNDISCDVFEGLVKLSTLSEERNYDPDNVRKGLKLKVPLKCACPDENDTRQGLRYLVTYPIQEMDEPGLIAEKFGISLGDLLAQNSMVDSNPTLFTNTTVLVPLRDIPIINWNLSDPGDRDHGFTPFSPSEMIDTKARSKILYVIVTIIGLFSAFVLLSGVSFCCRAKNRKRGVKIKHSSSHSTPTCLSPDIIAVMSKYSLISYTTEELSKATNDFSKETQLGSSVFKGRIGDNELVIKKMGFGDARRTISIHSKINHSSIVQLEGVCYGDDEYSSSFLVFEFARNGSLRDCLKNSANALSWQKRTQIAFDIAIGLHYIHHCTIPSYIHMNVNSRNILITEDWRAKIANLGEGSIITNSYETVSTKVDVFGFGVVLFDILSAKEIKDGSLTRQRLGFLHGEGGGGDCFDELRGVLDPNLKDYPVGDALCMIVLAKGCVDKNPMNRPSMNDILKILARMVR
ncbi:uncharacterized protein A4U43_C10F15840 [Asparagus officinalis]|uniref:Protein kinase domain-containing protein n=1 Tax=Asparagus officinalis TaxID=4686 RepID=A0A5P1E3H9_ASPOF|nr:lysM domain receptor-like kinase 4 [Asparagus officinalis]ONK57029.1 uncharacterized protein A4U43_C10F15840 [Asparagus officinalis]